MRGPGFARFGRLAMAGLLLAPLGLSSLLLVGPSAMPACAAGAAHAALVISTGETTIRYCVALDESGVSAIHVIELAHSQQGLEYRLGFGGEAVCELAGVGAGSGDCFGDYPDYWGFWMESSGGDWTWAGSGAGSTTVHDGDVEGWSWGTGDSGTTHPAPPAAAIGSVCVTSDPTPSSSPSTSPPPKPSTSAVGSSVHTGSSKPQGGASPTRQIHPTRSAAAVAARGSPGPSTSSDDPRVVAAAVGGGSSGPGAGALIAVALALALGVAGWLRVRIKRAETGVERR